MICNLLLHRGVEITPEMRASLPEKFNNPFSYIPCGLCREAAVQVMEYLQGCTDWEAELQGGKMFGVLVVETREGELGYLAAFSGNLMGRNDWEFFVPPVYDLLLPDDFFKVGEREISALNCRIASEESSGKLVALRGEIASVQRSYKVEIARLKEIYAAGKREREQVRNGLEDSGREDVVGKNEILARLNRDSQFQKAEIKRAERRMRDALEPLQARLADFLSEIESMKELRKEKSAALQEEIFRHFVFLNARGERKDLLEIFSDYYSEEAVLPPGGAGECAAPKLLQYAYMQGMRPVAMGEFWYGESPKGEIRLHGEFYPSCKGKCAPILGFMLQGVDVDKAGVHSCYGCSGSIEILYSDEHILAVNKPAGVLSVPGKDSGSPYPVAVLGDRVTYQNAVYKEIDILELLSFSDSFAGEKLYVVHRLDMHTSGVLLLARNEEAYKELQESFALRKVSKKYLAVLEGVVSMESTGSAVVWDSLESGIISLPLLPDYNNRPAQMVDFERGKEAVTRFRILKTEGKRTFVEFSPVTGRTHQLRVHSAHKCGLNTPIVGDLLYGTPAHRLMLHSYSVMFHHPANGRLVEITAPVPEEFQM